MTSQLSGQKWILIGHRGAGKSTYLQQIRAHFELAFDLDEEIEKRQKLSIPEIFKKYGEPAFRELEDVIFQQILDEHPTAHSIVVAVGAGFGGGIYPREFKTLWLRRETDMWPRFYTDKPLMGTSTEGLTFMKAFVEREERYRKWMDFAWTLSEGEACLGSVRATIPVGPPKLEQGILTLHPHTHKKALVALKDRLDWGLEAFEVRTDLLATPEIVGLVQEHAPQILLSLRTDDWFAGVNAKALPLDKLYGLDWDLKLGAPPKNVPLSIFSLHDFSQGLAPALAELSRAPKKYGRAAHLKASPLIRSFADLQLLHAWWKEDPASRSILPRTWVASDLPRWQWFRLWMKSQQKLNFIREAAEGLRDQPTLAQWQDHSATPRFGAVLGDPVVHSISPLRHREFFNKAHANFLAIPLPKTEATRVTFEFLESLGLAAAAITSPLKEAKLWADISEPGHEAAAQVANTLSQSTSGWQRWNTDRAALEPLLQCEDEWIIWGSGAVGRQLFAQATNAVLYSASRQVVLERKGSVTDSHRNTPLIWAAGDEAAIPEHLHPRKIYDLSYTERSRARLWVATLQQNNSPVEYRSGLQFFETQAREQQEIWLIGLANNFRF